MEIFAHFISASDALLLLARPFLSRSITSKTARNGVAQESDAER
jgi:hypothetical protein